MRLRRMFMQMCTPLTRLLAMVGACIALVAIMLYVGTITHSAYTLMSPTKTAVFTLNATRRVSCLEGMAAISAYNEQLPTMLSQLLADRQTYALTAEEIAVRFSQQSGAVVSLVKSDSDVFLAAIHGLKCPVSSHDNSFFTVFYVLDRRGSIDKIASSPSGFHTIQWLRDRWVVIAKNAYAGANEALPEYTLWHVVREGSHWTKSYSLSFGTAIGFTISFLLHNDYQYFTVNVGPRYVDAPCQAIKDRLDYYLTRVEWTRTYQWNQDHYKLIAQATTTPIVVLSNTNAATPGGYVAVKNWPDLCSGTP